LLRLLVSIGGAATGQCQQARGVQRSSSSGRERPRYWVQRRLGSPRWVRWRRRRSSLQERPNGGVSESAPEFETEDWVRGSLVACLRAEGRYLVERRGCLPTKRGGLRASEDGSSRAR